MPAKKTKFNPAYPLMNNFGTLLNQSSNEVRLLRPVHVLPDNFNGHISQSVLFVVNNYRSNLPVVLLKVKKIIKINLIKSIGERVLTMKNTNNYDLITFLIIDSTDW